ncbi:MAG: beta-ketoacyl synthase chain length factor [Bacteroidales bacterium]|jgi:3-oxoacyl-(acyl-carrier-protein) synthase|nr:beta-ketoacyl synthase chain length factor [Bacteroidales bacterium]
MTEVNQRQPVYIFGARQISVQPPLTEQWMDEPLEYTGDYVRAIEPDFKQYLPPNVSRRAGVILKRALLTARLSMQDAGISAPDAIITGTGLGCIENTEIFLNDLTRSGEQLLKPTCFMQSTHNTVSATIAIDCHCNGYNSTYAHKGISFELALQDAVLQLQRGDIATALVGAHDEMTPDYFTLLKRSGYLGTGVFAGETAVSFLLGREQASAALCRICGLTLQYCPSAGVDEWGRLLDRFLEEQGIDAGSIDAVMTGLNGQPANDRVYREMTASRFPPDKLLHYKHLFGESYTASALGCYAAAVCLHQRRIPAWLFAEPGQPEHRRLHNILVYNQFENKNHTFILLETCGR